MFGRRERIIIKKEINKRRKKTKAKNERIKEKKKRESNK